MSTKTPLLQAEEIIERFGGIRPMAAKIDTPVTTVQGWKKRGVIPANRRDAVLKAAEKLKISLADLIEDPQQSSAVQKIQIEQSVEENETKPFHQKIKTNDNRQRRLSEENIDPIIHSAISEQSDKPFVKETVQTQRDEKIHNYLLSELEENNRKAIASSTWITTGLILVTTIAAGLLFWPNLKENQTKLTIQDKKISNLVSDVQAVRQETEKKFLGPSIPEDFQEKFDSLQNQARNISVTVDQLTEKAKQISQISTIDGSNMIVKRLETLETKFAEMSGPDGSYAGIVARIRDLEDSVMGQMQLKDSARQLRNLVEEPHTQGNLSTVQEAEQGALGQTLQGVPKDDLKAAAILIAFSQLRASLEREDSFDGDLALLQKLLGDEDPELQDSLNRLSVHADNGVLTLPGLSKELRKLTGEVVVSSLKGEDVSIPEKAKAHFGNLVQIEKDGKMINGTQTQTTMAQAQKLIDEGKLEEGIDVLGILSGDEAKIVTPLIEKAEATLLAEKVKAMLTENILNHPGSRTGSLELNNVIQQMQQINPLSSQIITDEETGLSILPPKNDFQKIIGR